ncbi:alpha-L-rhamnosidase C-terminal domain-containing protein [Alloscardovia omnicolens]|uniref:alpha-L-rhamnosidase C-terminal domain-containing protein n=1 Tax=Alloscardovia omnicolens TaxID=419015 RepID=UPI003A6A2839
MPSLTNPSPFAKRSFQSEYGTIVCNWKKEVGQMFYHVEIPRNTTATIILPDGTEQEVGSGVYVFVAKLH